MRKKCNMNILLVDYDPDSRARIADFLRDLGHQVTERSNVEEAYATYITGAFSLVITDIKMPAILEQDLLLGANAGSNFVALIYNVSAEFLDHFNGIFKAIVNNGIETESILEPVTIIAMIVYAIMAYGVVWLFEIYEILKDRGMR